ncbi:MAG: hypothetical protein L0210_12160 [Rhodospirillales bacterium]|nr:hypothetical protein [Rhodospirillales bacterium]
MKGYDTVRSDFWTIALPSDWKDKGKRDGALYFESSDGAKAMYISTVRLGSSSSKSPREKIAESFRAMDLETLREMKRFKWKTMKDETTHSKAASIVMLDSFAASKRFRILGKILVHPPVVVRAAFYDYACEDYAASDEYFAPIIKSLRLRASRMRSAR